MHLALLKYFILAKLEKMSYTEVLTSSDEGRT